MALINTALPPAAYDVAQAVFGLQYTLRRLSPHFSCFDGGQVLDVGGGTGLYRTIVPSTARYVCLDNDPRKLDRLRRRHSQSAVMVGDATSIALRTQSVDYAMCVAVAHHLCDTAFDLMMSEVARVVRRRFVFLDAIRDERSMTSRVLWNLDAGAFPREKSTLLAALEMYFKIEHTEVYAIYHRYLLCVAVPLPSISRGIS